MFYYLDLGCASQISLALDNFSFHHIWVPEIIDSTAYFLFIINCLDLFCYHVCNWVKAPSCIFDHLICFFFYLIFSRNIVRSFLFIFVSKNISKPIGNQNSSISDSNKFN